MSQAETGLRSNVRLITTHNAEGKSVLSTRFEETVPQQAVRLEDGDPKMFFSLPFVTDAFPIDMTNDQDLNAYSKHLDSSPGLVNKSGTIVRIVDFKPGLFSPMHRTVSLDLGVVLEGQIELVLDSGETRVMSPGDQCIQRGTMHAWRNCSTTEWARMLFVLQPTQPLLVAGEELGEEIPEKTDVRASS